MKTTNKMKKIIQFIRMNAQQSTSNRILLPPFFKSLSSGLKCYATIVTLILTTTTLFGKGLWEEGMNSSGMIYSWNSPSGKYFPFLADGNSSFATNRGSLMIGGSLTFQFRKRVDGFEDRSILFELEPKVSVFVAPSFAIGGTILTRYYKYGDFGATTLWGFGPALTYFIGGRNNKVVYPYLEGSFIFTGNSHIITYSELEFGAMIMLSDAVGLTASLKYRLDIHYPEGSQAEHINNIILGVGIRSFIFR